jgi:hypothetical protein
MTEVESQVPKKLTETERIVNLVADLQAAFPNVLTDVAIKKALKNTKLTRSFPSKWGGKSKVRAEGTPKGFKNSYIFFSSEMREKNKEKYKSMKNGEIAVEISGIWKKMSSAEQEVYNKLAAEDKIRFRNEMKAFDPSYAEKSERPKKPKNAYQLFLEKNKDQILSQNPSVTAKERQKLFNSKWAAISKEEKEAYSAEAKKLRSGAESASAEPVVVVVESKKKKASAEEKVEKVEKEPKEKSKKVKVEEPVEEVKEKSKKVKKTKEPQ